MRIFRLMLVLLLLWGWTADAVKRKQEESVEERALRLEQLRLQAAENRCAVRGDITRMRHPSEFSDIIKLFVVLLDRRNETPEKREARLDKDRKRKTLKRYKSFYVYSGIDDRCHAHAFFF